MATRTPTPFLRALKRFSSPTCQSARSAPPSVRRRILEHCCQVYEVVGAAGLIAIRRHRGRSRV